MVLMGIGAGWYYDSLDGMVVHQNFIEGLVPASYYHGPYPTEAAAKIHAGITGPPSTTNASTGNQVATAAGSITGTASVTSFLTSLSRPQTWQRVAEGVIGILLILVGVAKLAESSPVASAIKKVPFI
jgi:hypothetical protein